MSIGRPLSNGGTWSVFSLRPHARARARQRVCGLNCWGYRKQGWTLFQLFPANIYQQENAD